MTIDDLEQLALLLLGAAEENVSLLLSEGLNGLNVGRADKKQFECTGRGVRLHASCSKLAPCA